MSAGGAGHDPAAGTRKAARGGWWVEQGLRPVLIAAMMACLALLLDGVLQAMAPLPSVVFFPVFVFMACLEGIVSERVLRERRVGGLELGLARGAELVVLLLLFKLGLALLPGWDAFPAALADWLAHPGEIVGPADLTYGPAMVMLWLASLSVGAVARELDEEVGRGPEPADKSSAAYYLWQTQVPPQRDREGALARLGSQFVWGGVAALILAAAAQGLTGAAVAVPTVLYFMLGLALLTQARFSVVRGEWQLREVPVEASLGKRWLAWAILFLVGIGLLALLVPTGFLEAPVQMVRTALVVALFWIGTLLTWIFYLLSIPLGLLIPKLKQPDPPAALPMGEMPEPLALWGSPAPWLRMAGVALFWLALAALLVLATVRFVRDRRSPAPGGRALRGLGAWWHRLLSWLRVLWKRPAALVEAARLRRRGRRQAGEAQAASPPHRLSLRRLAPADRVRFFYVSTVRRAAEAGSPRAPGQTPYEYRSSLQERFPDVEPDLQGLTEAFVAVRYSRRSIEAEDAEQVRPLWQRIQAALRRARRGRAREPRVPSSGDQGAGPEAPS